MTSAPHFAARIEDAVHRFRERRGRKRGLVPTIVPFTGYGGDGWVRVLGRVVLLRPEDGDDQQDAFTSIRGWRSFINVHVRDIDVTVTSGRTRRTIRADRGGVLDAHIEATLPPGWHRIRLSIPGGHAVEAPVFIVDESVGVGLVSDIDDTVMVTALPRPFLAAWNTFVLDEHARTPVAGMAVLYERLTRAHPGMPVVYLSTGAWNVVPTLSRFLGRNLYPRGTLLLTDWGPTHDRWFRSGPEHKRLNLERLASEFPGIRWILVGDDGQHDERIYADFVAAHPAGVAAVAIRQLTRGQAVLAGGRSGGEPHPGGVPWIYAPDGAGLSVRLSELGLLEAEPR
ncbi:MAG TPA: phosphatase domain-containing protein [Pseudolysinimonas sp.]|nr:phosphatase domain-containing protein [Pseudolysinimonas sp.]